MKFNTVKRSLGVCQRSVRWLRSALLTSSPCACYSISWWPLSSFSLWIILLPPSLPTSPFTFSTDKSLWLVPVSVGVGAHCSKAQVYQPWAGFAESGGPWISRAPDASYTCKRRIIYLRSLSWSLILEFGAICCFLIDGHLWNIWTNCS